MANAQRALRANSMLTRERILDASAQLFSERGYEGTSLRAIAAAAQVNLAAANYHFGSKSQLLEAAFQRCIAPINDERIRRLEILQAQPSPPGVEAIVRAFVDPGSAHKNDQTFPRFVARLFAEPKSFSVPFLERAFTPTVRPFFDALARALPTVDHNDLTWRFHFLIGAMIQLVHFEKPLHVFDLNPAATAGSSEDGIEPLVRFVVAGLCQGADDGAAR